MGKVIGITGGIATGKSTVSAILREIGYTVIDADVAARKVVEPGEEAFVKIVDSFGIDILQEDGWLDRKKLGDIVFHDENKRNLLNSIVHPAVRQSMLRDAERSFESGENVVFMDIPLLFESKLTWMVDKVIVVYVDEKIQLNRLMKRNGYSEEEAFARIQSQMPIEEKRKLGDAEIDNRGTIDETKEQLFHILKKWDITN